LRGNSIPDPVFFPPVRWTHHKRQSAPSPTQETNKQDCRHHWACARAPPVCATVSRKGSYGTILKVKVNPIYMFLRRAPFDLLFEILLIRVALRTHNSGQLFPGGAKLAISSKLWALCRCLCGYLIYTTIHVGTCKFDLLRFRPHTNWTGLAANLTKRIVHLGRIDSKRRREA